MKYKYIVYKYLTGYGFVVKRKFAWFIPALIYTVFIRINCNGCSVKLEWV